MDKLLFDANFGSNRFIEQMQSALFKACAENYPNSEIIGFANDKVVEEFSDNVDFVHIFMGNMNNLWRNTVIPLASYFNKETPFYFPCGKIPSLLHNTTPVISMIKDVLPLEVSGYFATEVEWKNYKREIQTDINRSDLIFVPSEHVKQKLQQEFLMLHEPVVLNYASLIPNEYLELPLPRKNEEYFFVEVDNISHTGLNEILKDFIYLHTVGKSKIRLYLSGDLRTQNEKLAINMQVAREVDAIREYRNLSAGQRSALLRGAIAALLPSNVDVLPISHLDAMKCSCPVITDNTPTVKEVCDNAVIYADIRDSESYNNILNRIQNDEVFRNEYIYRGKAREDFYNWNSSAKIFVDNVEKVCNYAE